MAGGEFSANQPFEEDIFDIPPRVYYRHHENVVTGYPIDDSPRWCEDLPVDSETKFLKFGNDSAPPGNRPESRGRFAYPL